MGFFLDRVVEGVQHAEAWADFEDLLSVPSPHAGWKKCAKVKANWELIQQRYTQVLDRLQEYTL